MPAALPSLFSASQRPGPVGLRGAGVSHTLGDLKQACELSVGCGGHY